MIVKQRNILWKGIFEIDMEKKISITLFPFMISAVMTSFLLKGLTTTMARYTIRTSLAAVLIFTSWGILFFIETKRLRRAKVVYSVKCKIVVAAILAGFLGLYFSYCVWSNGYLSLAPFELIDNGNVHLDNLFHSSIAESYKRGMEASCLINNEWFCHYHTFSHFLMGNIARVMGMPSLIAYNYLYPVVFIPLYVFAQLYAVSSAKKYFERDAAVSYIDIVVISLFNTGVAYKELIGSYGVWKTSYFDSESFLVANTLAFLFYGYAFQWMEKQFGNKKKDIFFICAVIPFFIFVISWAKISVGFIVTVSVMYAVFRKRMKDFRFWLANFLYFLEFLFCFWMFNGGQSGTGLVRDSFRLMAFEVNCSGPLGIWGHYIILLIMPVLFILFDIKKYKYTWRDFWDGKCIWIELVSVCCLMSFLPGFLINIGGGSAAYFSYVSEVVALVLLCGHNYIKIEEDGAGLLKVSVYVVSFSWCVSVSYSNSIGNPLDLITGTHASNLYVKLDEIRNMADGHPEKYTMYLEKDSFVLQVFQSGATASYICPAITGVGVINATYCDNGSYYTFLDEPVGYAYGFNSVDHGCLSYENAKQEARNNGKEKIIHMTSRGYEVENL